MWLTVEPLLKDTLNNGHDTKTSLLKTNLAVPAEQLQFHLWKRTILYKENSSVYNKKEVPMYSH